MNGSPDVHQYERDYPVMFGKLFGSLGNLELNIRVALYLMDTPKEMRRPPDWRIANLAIDEEVEKSWLTGWHYLSGLIEAFNKRQKDAGLETVDTDIADLRNALAHGQVSSATTTGLFVLIKFGSPKNGAVKVSERYELTYEWFARQLAATNAAIIAVNQRLHALR